LSPLHLNEATLIGCGPAVPFVPLATNAHGNRFSSGEQRGRHFVGILMGISDDPEGQARVAVFRQALAALGWTEGRNIQFIYRWSAGDVVHARQFAKELLDLRSDVILANSTPIAVAVRDITRTTPTVFVQVSDPITAGVVLRLIERDAVITIIDARDHVGRILGGLGSQGPDCVAGHVGLELRNVAANYPFESSRGFPGSEPNSGQTFELQALRYSKDRI
jgi:ABC transporter substrate binding protein